MSPVETLLAEVLRAHRYMATNQASRTGCHGCRWTFRPGQTERGRRAHEAHVAAEQAKALQAWLLSDGTGADVLSQHQPLSVQGILAAVADLIGGAS